MSAASDPNATAEEKEIEMFKIRKLIKNLEAARGCVALRPHLESHATSGVLPTSDGLSHAPCSGLAPEGRFRPHFAGAFSPTTPPSCDGVALCSAETVPR